MKKALIVLLSVLVLFGCSSKNASFTADMVSESNTSILYGGNYELAAAPNTVNEQESKIIVSGSLRLETKNMEQILEEITGKVKEAEGYIQNSNTSKNYHGNRYFIATIRIPSENYDSFVESLKGTGNTVEYTYSTKDITDEYYDYKTRLTTLEAEYEKVLEFYDRANTIEELMSIEERLTDIQYEIDSIKNRIKNYDLLTGYSTLELSITETEILTNTEENFSAKVNNAFIEGIENLKLSIQNFIVFAAYYS